MHSSRMIAFRFGTRFFSVRFFLLNIRSNPFVTFPNSYPFPFFTKYSSIVKQQNQGTTSDAFRGFSLEISGLLCIIGNDTKKQEHCIYEVFT
jgi:hypothetical protein